jgi:HEAT repeat protein/GTPase SAR1 family protein
MARKYGKNETTLSNVLKLVKALLALADEEIAVPGDKLKATFKVEWEKEDELLVSGKVQEKCKNRTQTVEKGITKDDLWELVECSGEALELPQSKDEKKKPTETDRKANAIQDILDCLKDLDILVEKTINGKPTVKTHGFWKFSLKLKHQTKTEENLKLIQERWKLKIGSITTNTSDETFISKDKFLNWREICSQNLAQQKQLTTNPFTNAYGVTPQLDEIYVPLAIVERKPPKPPSRNQPEEKEEEKLIPIAEERFFEDVLRQGKSQISQGRKIAIIGEPGSGKTTRLQKIADWILEPDQEDLGFPIWIDLADLENQDICQYLENKWLPKCKGGVKRSDLEPQISRAWLLLDGVDEMSRTQRIEQLAKDLSSSWLQDARVVATCRVNVWEADKNAFSGFDVFRNLEFNPEQVTDYIRDWFAGMRDAATGESLEAELAESENSRLKELIQNPLRLWMLCQIWQTGGGLPETQAGLYGQFVDWVYDWKADEEILDQREAIDTALARLALAAMEQKDEVSRLRLRESWVVKVLGSRPIFQAVMKLGWLNRVERFPEAICVFYHATFQEYFAALAVDDWDYFLPRNHVNFPVAGKEYRIFEPQWKQVILLWLGRGDDKLKKEELINVLVNFEDQCGGFYKFQAYFLGASAIAELSEEYSKAREIVNEIVKWSFGYFNIECQEQQTNVPRQITEAAKAILPETHRSILVETLIDLLTSPNKYTRIEVAESLGEIAPGHFQVVATLMNLINQSSVPGIRMKAVIALAKVVKNNQEKIDLLTSLCNKSDPLVSSIAAQCLGKIDPNHPQAEPFSVRVQSTSFQESVKSGKIDPRNSQVIESLINEVRFSDNNNQKLNAVKNLGDTHPRDPEVIIKLLIDLINNHNTENKISHEAIRSLGRIGKNSDEGINFLISLIANSQQNLETLQEVVQALQYINISHQEVINALLNLIGTISDKPIRLGATRSLRQILQRNPLKPAISALKNCISVGINGQQNTDIYLCCYEVLWHCSQILPYPEFYRAWNGLTEN